MNNRKHVLCSVVLLSVVVVAAAWLAGGARLLGRPFWMDELHTWLIVSDPDVSHAMSALADGVDFNPPTYFVAARAWSSVFSSSESGLRLFSAACMLAAAAILLVTLSRSFSVSASMAGVVAVFSHRLIIFQAFEARFYALWVLLIAVLCCLLTGLRAAKRPGVRLAGIAVVVVCVCTVHYFGILSVFAVVCAWFIAGSRTGKDWLWAGVILLVGVLALGCCAPLLVSQKAALTRATWVSFPTVSSTLDFLAGLVSWKTLLPCLVAGGLCRLMGRQKSEADSNRNSGADLGVQASVLGLLLMPVMIVGLSWTVQPALVDRYAIVGLIGLAPVYAVALSGCPLAIRLAAVAGALAVFVSNVDHCRQSWDYRMGLEVELQAELQTLGEDVPVIFEDRISSMPAVYAGGFPGNWSLADFRDDQLITDSNLRVVQRDVGRRIAEWYPVFRMRSVDSLADESEVVVVPYRTSEVAVGLVYPEGFSATVTESGLIRLRRGQDSDAE